MVTLAAFAYFIFCLIYIWRMPGVFAGLMLCSFGLAVFFGSIGGIVSVIAVMASAGGYLYGRVRSDVWVVSDVGFALWLAQTTLFAFWSPQMEISGYVLSTLYGLGVSSYIFARTFAATPNFMRQLYWSTIFATTITYVSLVGSASRFGRLGATDTNTTLNAVGLSVLGEVGLILSMALLFFDKETNTYLKALVFLLAVAVLLPFTLSTGSRGPLVSCGIVFVGYMLLFLARANLRQVLAAFATLAVGVPTATALFVAIAPQRVVTTLLGGVLRLVSTTQGYDRSVGERFDSYQQAWALIKDAPFLGYGPGAFYYMNDGISATTNYPHNLELELLVTGGFLGLSLFAWFVFPLLLQSFLAALRRPLKWEAAAVFGLIVSGLIRFQTSFTIASAKQVYFALGCAAAIWAAQRIAERERNAQQPDGLANLSVAGSGEV